MNRKNIEDCVWKSRKNEYYKEYMRTNLIYNVFTKKQEKYKGQPCPEGLVRHHIYYDINNINVGIIFITASQHMKIHQQLKNSHETIPIICNWEGRTYIYNQEMTEKEHIQEYTEPLSNYV